MRSFIALLAIGHMALAQSNYTVDPDTVDIGKAVSWCESQYNTCNTLCMAGGDGTKVDTCDSGSLQYECLCRNGTAPGLEYYEGSLDTLMCQESYSLCVEANVGDVSAQSTCQTDIRDTCGSLDAKSAQAPAASTTTNEESSAATETTDSTSTDTPDSGAGSIPRYANAAGAMAIGLFVYML